MRGCEGKESGLITLQRQNPKIGRRPLDLEAVRRAYRRYASVYDVLFGPSLDAGRRAAVAAINRSGARRVLEVGVGTGLTLPGYRIDMRVVGIDLCPEMLRRARRRVTDLRLNHVEALVEMDGQDMAFTDGSFDAVVAHHVLSAAPDPVSLLREMRRVCAEGGEILILNHFVSRRPAGRWLERATAPLAALLGFRPNLDRAILEGVADLQLIDAQDLAFPGNATLLRIRKRVRQPAFAAAQ